MGDQEALLGACTDTQLFFPQQGHGFEPIAFPYSLCSLVMLPPLSPHPSSQHPECTDSAPKLRLVRKVMKVAMSSKPLVVCLTG